jgi:hypothetical protein
MQSGFFKSEKKLEKTHNRYFHAAAVKKTTFFRVLVETAIVPPNLDAGLSASRWLLWHRTPIVFLSCEIQTTLPMEVHSGQFLWSPILTVS